MKYLKNIGKTLFYVFGLIIIFTFFITFLNYLNIISTNLISIFELLIILFSSFFGGFIFGKNSKKNGWLEGIKLGLIIIFVLFLLNILFFKNKVNSFLFLYYFIILISSTLGGMLGISKKK